MFLFTNSPASAEPARDKPLADVLRGAANDTGVSFDYLVKTAKRESNLDPMAKARTSSASGLFQFLDQTWLSTVRIEGAKFGLGEEAQQITQSSSGRLSVPDADSRKKIMALRNDPVVSSKLAAAFTLRNQSQLADNLGRSPSEGELYIAHFLGASGATDLIRLASEQPDASAASSFPDAAGANRPIFYDKSGKAKSVLEVYSSLVSQYSADTPAVGSTQPVASSDVAVSPSDNAYRAKEGGKPLFGLFRGKDTGPVAQPIQNAWRNMGRNSFGTGGKQLASLNTGGFFPTSAESSQSNPVSEANVSSQIQPAANLPLVNVPLPPEKPADLASVPPRKQRAIHAPLDLLSFIRQRV